MQPRPVIVCGMPRTGTSLVGQLLKTTGLVVYPELSPESLPSLFPLVGELRSVLAADTRRGFDPALIDDRILEFVAALWAAGRAPRDAAGAERGVGLKQPGAERFGPEFRRALGPYAPRYVYTLRDPVAAYDSTLRTMGRWGDIGPGDYADRWDRSLADAAALADAGDLVPFAAASSRVGREDGVAAVLRFLDLIPTRRTEIFVGRWPDVNTSGGRNLGHLSDAEIAARVEAFSGARRLRGIRRRIARLVAG